MPELRGLRLRRPGPAVLYAILAIGLGSAACGSVAHAAYYYRQTLGRILELEEAFERYGQETGREPPLDGARTWASCLLWDLDEPDLLKPRFLSPYYFSVGDPTMQSRPADVVVLDGWGNPILALKDASGLLLYSRGADEIDDRGMLDDISNRWGIRAWYYGGKDDAVLAAKVAAGMLALALAFWGFRRFRKRGAPNR
jgi:hypothetical protein